MKSIEFDHTSARWDRYRAFHKLHYGLFVQFDTGEWIVMPSRFTPNKRKVYRDLEVTIFAPQDRHCNNILNNMYTPDGQRVLKSHLGPGTYLYDHATKQVVCLSTRYNEKADVIPSRFDGASMMCYYPGAGRKPVPFGSVYIARPRKVDKAERAEVRKKITVIKTQVRLGLTGPVERKASWDIASWDAVRDTAIEEMSPEFKQKVANKVAMPVERPEFDYLVVRES